MSSTLHLDVMSSQALKETLTQEQTVALLPLGSLEPHGPHLPLSVDRLLSEVSAQYAAQRLVSMGVPCLIAPAVPYAVTEFARGFTGALSIPQDLYESLIETLVHGYLEEGFVHVCLINHHLEPKQLEALKNVTQKVKQSSGAHAISYPLVVSKRWGRHLGAEFKSGACHAGAYEGSMIRCSHPSLFNTQIANELPELTLSLSQGIQEGVEGFIALGMNEAYTGAPAKATVTEGERLYQCHAEMIATEVSEALQNHQRHTHN